MSLSRTIAISTSTFAKEDASPLHFLQENGWEYVLNPHGRVLTAAECVDFFQGCVGVIAGTELLSASVLSALPQLRVISRCGVGLDSVDKNFAQKRGIAVLTTSADMLAMAVAEHTLGQALALLRHTAMHDAHVRQGQWQKRMGWLLQGKKVGIVGLGRMGKAVARIFLALGCEVAFADVQPIPATSFSPVCATSVVSATSALQSTMNSSPTDAKTCGFSQMALPMSLPSLLAWADIITLHCTAEALIAGDGVTCMEAGAINTKGTDAKVIGAQELALMRPGTWLINTARGSLVDEEALYGALMCGHLAGAALDVFSEEPYRGKLLSVKNCLLSPHVASYAREVRIHMEMEAAQNMCTALAGL